MLNRDTLYELRTLVARYPYFQSLRLLYLKNLYLLHDITFGAELRKAVLYVADRRVLFYLIEGDRYTLKPQKSPLLSSKVLEEEPSMDRTLSLIDAFLATVPEEHSQATELDYAMDYTAYLLQDDGTSDAASGDGGEQVPKLRGHELIDDFLRQSESGERPLFERSAEPETAPSSPAYPETAPLSLAGTPETSASAPVSLENTTASSENILASSGKNADTSVSSENDVADEERPLQDSMDDSCFTETLAKIYIKQHRYEKALEIIKKLSLKYPKKNAYFADQIRFLEKLIINAKSK